MYGDDVFPNTLQNAFFFLYTPPELGIPSLLSIGFLCLPAFALPFDVLGFLLRQLLLPLFGLYLNIAAFHSYGTASRSHSFW